MGPQFHSQLRDVGWVKTPSNVEDPKDLADFLESIAPKLGQSIRTKHGVIEGLSPRSAETGNPCSLSGKFSFAPFPLHCDTSHWLIPCRFVILACVDPGSIACPTILLDLADVNLSSADQALVRSAVFLIRNGRGSFYSSIFSDRRNFIRLDPGCMEAITKEGHDAMELYAYANQSHRVQKISWSAGDVLIIDNWRMLHGRGEHADTSPDRKLLRATVR